MSDYHYCDSRDFCDEAWDELSQLRARYEWRLMDTAPKDGTTILVTNGSDYALQRWSAKPGLVPSWIYVSGGEMCWWIGFDNMEEPEIEPTHWMPLPEPPSS